MPIALKTLGNDEFWENRRQKSFRNTDMRRISKKKIFLLTLGTFLLKKEKCPALWYPYRQGNTCSHSEHRSQAW